MPMAPPCINLSTTGMTSKLSKRTATRSMTGSLQTPCKPVLRKPKSWSSLQNMTHIRALSFTSTTKLLRELVTSRSLVFVSLPSFPGTSTLTSFAKITRRIIGLIHRIFHLATEHLRHTLYITLVRPILEYSCATLHPLNKTLTNRSESVQRFACRSYCSPGTWNMMIFFPAHPFPHSNLIVNAQLWFMSSKFLPVSLLLPMYLFLTLVPIQDVTNPVCSTMSTSLLVALCSVKEASFILGLNFGISCLKMLCLLSLCLPSRLL